MPNDVEQLGMQIALPRRAFVNGLTIGFCVSVLLAVRAAKTRVAASLGVPRRAAVDPRQFGAKFDGVTDDTRAWQAAINHAVATGAPVRPSRSGTSVIRCSPLPRGAYPAYVPELPIYQALDINFSNLTIDLAGSRLRVIGQAASNAVNYAFGTKQNLRLGTLRNIRIGNGTIDFDPTADPSPNKRSFYLVGVEGVYVDDLLLTSSGPRAGGTITLQNCRTVRMRNLRCVNITQGMNLSFVDDVVLDTLLFDNFREAIDCDRKVTGLTAKNLKFRNGGPTNQCIDLNSVVDVFISGIDAYNVGNIALVNYKLDTPKTFVAWIRRDPVSEFSPSKNVTIEKVRGDKICFPASTTRPFLLGNDQQRPEESAFPLENITLRDVVLTNCPSFIPVELVKDATIENFHFEGAENPVPGIGCIDIRSDYTGTTTSAVLRNVTIETGRRATCGIRASGVASLELDEVRVRGQSAPRAVLFDFANLEQNGARVRLKRVTATTQGDGSAIAFRFGGTGNAGNPYYINWGAGNCAQGSFARTVVLNGNAAARISQLPVPSRSCGD